MKPRKLKMNEAQQRWVREWWRALQPRSEGDDLLPGALSGMGRGDRAQLRRCGNANELLAHRSTLLLASRLVSLGDGSRFLSDDAASYERIAWAGGVLALIKEDLRDNKSLAFHLSQQTGDRPKMSEMRFNALQRSSALHELFKHWRRAVRLAGCKVDVVRLADDLLSWMDERNETAARTSSSVMFHWAYDYYLSTREKSAAEEPQFNKEIIE